MYFELSYFVLCLFAFCFSLFILHCFAVAMQQLKFHVPL